MHVVDCLYVCGNFGMKVFYGGRTMKPGKNVLLLLYFFTENERIGNSCWDGTNKTLDFSLDLR